MKIRRILIFLFLLIGSISQAQDDPIKDLNNPLYTLPDNMPLQTKLLWAENGLLRKTNLFQVDRPRELELRTKKPVCNVQYPRNYYIGGLSCIKFSTIFDSICFTNNQCTVLLEGSMILNVIKRLS